MYNIGICDDEKSTCTESENIIEEYKRKNHLQIWHNGNLFFSFHFGGRHYNVLFENIIYFSSMNKKIQILTTEKTFVFYGKLKDILPELPMSFIQIHQSNIVNQNYISECTYESIKMMNGDILSISRKYRMEVRQKTKEYLREREQ